MTPDQIIAFVRKWPADAQNEFEERIAIMQFCGGKTEHQAYIDAFECVGVRVASGVFRKAATR